MSSHKVLQNAMWYFESSFGGRVFAKMIRSSSSSFLHAPLWCDFVATPIKRWFLFLYSLSLDLTMWVVLANGTLAHVMQVEPWKVLYTGSSLSYLHNPLTTTLWTSSGLPGMWTRDEPSQLSLSQIANSQNYEQINILTLASKVWSCDKVVANGMWIEKNMC